MTIKLPIILSAMIAALAISDTLASQAGTEEAAPTEAMASEAAPTDAAAPAEAMSEATPADAAKEEPKMAKKRKRHSGHHSGKHHKRHHGGPGHSTDKWDAPYDQVQKDGDSSGCSGDSSSDAGKHLPEETPGQKGPRVPMGE